MFCMRGCTLTIVHTLEHLIILETSNNRWNNNRFNNRFRQEIAHNKTLEKIRKNIKMKKRIMRKMIRLTKQR